MLEKYLSSSSASFRRRLNLNFRVSSCSAPLHQMGSHSLAWLEELSQTLIQLTLLATLHYTKEPSPSSNHTVQCSALTPAWAEMVLLSSLQTAFQQDSLAGRSHMLIASYLWLAIQLMRVFCSVKPGTVWHVQLASLTQTHYSVALTEALNPL